MGALSSLCDCAEDQPKKISNTLPPPARMSRLSSYNILGHIGAGSYSEVLLVEPKSRRRSSESRTYALKCVSKKKLQMSGIQKNALFEVQLLRAKISPFLINLQKAFQDQRKCYLLVEYAEGGDLYSFISNFHDPGKVHMFRKEGERAVRFVIACIVLALEALHQKVVIYRDLKPENVLVMKNGYAKLADFGLSKKSDKNSLSRTMAGSPLYLAPQAVELEGYGHMVDFWSLGVLLYELLFFRPPFDRSIIQKGQFKIVCQKAQDDYKWINLEGPSNSAKMLIQELLTVDPRERLGAGGIGEIKSHQFFEDFNWRRLERMQVESPLCKIVEEYPCRARDRCSGWQDSDIGDGLHSTSIRLD